MLDMICWALSSLTPCFGVAAACVRPGALGPGDTSVVMESLPCHEGKGIPPTLSALVWHRRCTEIRKWTFEKGTFVAASEWLGEKIYDVFFLLLVWLLL